jgi:hypothetical protein
MFIRLLFMQAPYLCGVDMNSSQWILNSSSYDYFPVKKQKFAWDYYIRQQILLDV